MTAKTDGVRAPSLVYLVAYPLLRAAISTRVRFIRCGVENIPSEGGFIFAGNHTSNLDPFAVTFVLPSSRPVCFLAKQEMFRSPIPAWFFRSVHQFPVDRGKPDRTAIRWAIDWLKSGHILGIFPQGTRMPVGPVTSAQEGVAFIAFQAGARMLPVAITHGPSRGIRRRVVALTYGKPLDPADYQELPKRERMQQLTADVVSGINEALAVNDECMRSCSCG